METPVHFFPDKVHQTLGQLRPILPGTVTNIAGDLWVVDPRHCPLAWQAKRLAANHNRTRQVFAKVDG